MKKSLFLMSIVFIFVLGSARSSAQSIASYFVQHQYDVCGTYNSRVVTTHYSATQTLKYYWGDGSSGIQPVSLWGIDTGNTYRSHPYSLPGTYTIKIVLYDGAPLDSVTFAQEVYDCNFLTVSAILDVNADCMVDSGDSKVHAWSEIEIDSSGVTIDTIPMYAHFLYRASGPAGTIYRLRQIAPPAGLSLACSSSGIVYDTIPSTPFVSIPRKYMLFDCSTPSSDFDLGISASFYPNRYMFSPSPSQNGIANLWVTNSACTGTPAQVRFDYSPKYTFDSVVPAYSYTVSGTSVTFDLGSISAQTPLPLTVFLTPVVTLVMGDTVNSTFTISPITGDTNPGNNVVSRCDTIKSSFDPNHKSVTPTGDISPGMLLEYMLEFENTGNDTAHNIHIMDTLSDFLDPGTIKGGSSSHAVGMFKFSDGPFNILKFDFPNIMLPDSSHHELCKGMVTFSIKAKSTLSPGDVIANRVGIYFDVNDVVMTNTVFSQFPLPSGIEGTGQLSKVELYPNPVKDILNIATDARAYNALSIYNILGQCVSSQKMSANTTSINVSTLVPGSYYVSLKGEAGTRTIKFEKQ